MVTTKSNDVSASEFVPTEEVKTSSDLNGLTDSDLLSTVVSGILSRPLIREQVNEVLRQKSVKNKNGDVQEVFVHSESVILAALSSTIKKVLLLECMKKTDSCLRFTTYRGRICLSKVATNEPDSSFTKSEDKHICITGVIAKSRLNFIPFNVKEGKLTKEDINTLDGIKLAVMVVEAVGLTVFRQQIVSESNLSSNLTEGMKAFINGFKPESPRPLVLIYDDLVKDKSKDDSEKMCKQDYLDSIHTLAVYIKNQAIQADKKVEEKDKKLVASTRSRMLIPNISFALMEKFGRVERL